MVDIISNIRENKGRLFFLGVVEVPVMPHMPSMTSGKLPVLNHIRRPTMYPN